MSIKTLGQLIIILIALGAGYSVWQFAVHGAIGVTPKGLDDGLVGHWTMDGPDILTNIADVSGQGNDGKLELGSSGNTSTTTAIGRIGQAMEFDGSDDYVQVSDDPSISPQGSLAVSAWLKPDTTLSTTDNGSRALEKGDSYFFLQGDGSALGTGGMNFLVKRSNSVYAAEIGQSLSADRWYHLVGTFDGSDIRVYLDGALKDTTNVGGNIDNDNLDLYIGSDDSGIRFDGQIDDVRIYDRALSAAEIKQLYNLGAAKLGITPSGDTSGLVGHWTMDGPDILTNIADVSGQGNDGKLELGSSGNTSTTTAIGRIGQAMEFDGSDDYVQVDRVANDTTTDFSVGAWVNLPDKYTGTTWAALIGRNTSGGGNVHVLAVGDNVGGSSLDNQFSVHDGASAAFEGDTDTIIADNSWHHIFYTRSGSRGTLYVDGAQKSTHAVNYGTASSDQVSVAQEYDSSSTSDFAEGLIDDVRVYDRELSAAEIKQLYNLGAAKLSVSTQKALTDDLIIYYTFDGPEVSGSTVTDIAADSENNDGSMTSVSIVPGRFGQAFEFDSGAPSTVVPASPDPGNLHDAFTERSVSVWVQLGNDPNGPQIIWEEGGSTNGFVIGYRTSPDTIIFATNENLNGPTEIASTSTFVEGTGEWIHVVAVFDDGDMRLYIDGVQESSTTATASSIPDHGNDPALGDKNSTTALDTSGEDPFDGKIDEFRVYNRVLSAAEIKQLYNMGR